MAYRQVYIGPVVCTLCNRIMEVVLKRSCDPLAKCPMDKTCINYGADQFYNPDSEAKYFKIPLTLLPEEEV